MHTSIQRKTDVSLESDKRFIFLSNDTVPIGYRIDRNNSLNLSHNKSPRRKSGIQIFAAALFQPEKNLSILTNDNRLVSQEVIAEYGLLFFLAINNPFARLSQCGAKR